MIGLPKHLNSKDDFIYVKENFPKEKWIGLFQNLLDERMQWFNVGTLTDNEPGIEDDTHRVVTCNTTDGEERYQYELKENPNCNLFRLGFTVEEVVEIINEGEK